MKDEEFDPMLPFGKEARREVINERRLNFWGKKLFTIMILSFLIGTTMLNCIILISNNTYIWFSVILLLNAGLCSFVILIILMGKWG